MSPNYSQVDDDDDAIKVKASSAPLLAASFLFESLCKSINDKFMLCKSQHENNPVPCAEWAQAVLSCTNHTLMELGRRARCKDLFESFWRCLDYNNQDFIYCREEEKNFSKCTEQEMGVGRRLWQGRGPEEGWKEPLEKRPEEDSWSFQHHVWWYKNKPPSTNK